MDMAEDTDDIGNRIDIAMDTDVGADTYIDITGDHHNKWNKQDPKRKHLFFSQLRYEHKRGYLGREKDQWKISFQKIIKE